MINAWKPSRFNIGLQLSVKDVNLRCVYNVLTRSVILLHDPIIIPHWVEDWLVNSCDHLHIDKCALPTAFISELIASRQIIKDDFDELSIIRYLFNKGRYESSSSLALTILPTMKCNMGCTYCYEKQADTSDTLQTYMDQSICDSIVNFAEQRLNENAAVNIDWYGGEPLLAMDTIEYLVEQFLEKSHKHNWQVSSGIVSNGTRVNKRAIATLKKLNLTNAQITLDGEPAVHNKRRPYVDGSASYDDVLHGIRAFSSEGVLVRVRINVDREMLPNVDFARLALLLKNNFENTKCMFYLGKIRTFQKSIYTCIDSQRCQSQYLNTKEFTDARKAFESACVNCGLSTFKPSFPPLAVPCGALRSNHFAIIPSGDVYKCWGEIGMSNASSGIIAAWDECSPNHLSWLGFDPLTDIECHDCKFLPICMGDCAYYCRHGFPKSERCVFFRYTYEDTIRAFVEHHVGIADSHSASTAANIACKCD